MLLAQRNDYFSQEQPTYEEEMPPPKKLYRIGTPQCYEAVKKGIIELSLPLEDVTNNIIRRASQSVPDISTLWVLEKENTSSCNVINCNSSSKDNRDVTTSAENHMSQCEDSWEDLQGSEEAEESARNDERVNVSDNNNGERGETPITDAGREHLRHRHDKLHLTLIPAPSVVVSHDESFTMAHGNSGSMCSMTDNASPTRGYQLSDPTLPCFDDIIGHGHVKERIEEVLLPMTVPRSITNTILTGVRSMPASILMYGPPGVGKTKLARAVAGQAEAAFIAVGPSDILSKYVGESEASVRELFRKAHQQAHRMESKCAVLFFDEIDALGQSRDDTGRGEQGDSCSRRVLAELLIQLNGISSPCSASSEAEVCDRVSLGEEQDGHERSTTSHLGVSEGRVLVVAATNRMSSCDPALLRRFGIRVRVGLPTEKDRRRILKRLLRDVENTIAKVELADLASALEGWSGSDLECLTREATMAPVRECIRAAARMKRRARRRSTSTGTNELQISGSRECLVEGFQNMRPVTLEDFEHAIEFASGNQIPVAEGKASGPKPLRRYDSTSSSDEDEELSPLRRRTRVTPVAAI